VINILSVKWGTKFSNRYVNNLYTGVKNNIKIPFKFYCFTDNKTGLNKEIVALPLPKGIPYWWNKLYLFSNELPVEGRVLYIDLDTVIVGDITHIARCKEKFVMLQDVYHPERRGSGLMAWDTSNDYSVLWEKYHPQAQAIHERFWPHGDQVWIQQHLPVNPSLWQELYKNQILSLKVECVKQSSKPKDARIIFYHGKPSIKESLNIPNFQWIRKYWKNA